MPYVKPMRPCGVNPALAEDRMPVVKVVNGDSWRVDAEVWDPSTHEPGTFRNTVLKFTLSENRFERPLWIGRWYRGVFPDEVVPGLVHVRVPRRVSSLLRRGVYAFSIRMEGRLDKAAETQLTGHFQVEYEPTSPLHDIPYKSPAGDRPWWEVEPDEDEKDSPYVHRGSVATFADLPARPSPGDVYNVVAQVGMVPGGTNWVWTGSSWDSLGGPITQDTVVPAIENAGDSVVVFDEDGNPYVVRRD